MTAREPRVTVVIPHYNDGDLLGETLASIREDEPVRVIVVDDASTDTASLASLRAARETGAEVVMLTQNIGPAEAMNRGVEEAQTPYVFFLGADDLVVPGVLARLADALDADPTCDFAYGDYEFFGAMTGVMQSYEWEPWRAVYTSCWPGVFMVRRSVFRETRGFITRSAFEDWDYYMTLAEQGRRGIRVPGVSFRYRRAVSGRREQSNRHRLREERALMRAAHPQLMARRREMQVEAGVSLPVRMLYPIAYWLRLNLPVRAGDALFGVLAAGRRTVNRVTRR